MSIVKVIFAYSLYDDYLYLRHALGWSFLAAGPEKFHQGQRLSMNTKTTKSIKEKLKQIKEAFESSYPLNDMAMDMLEGARKALEWVISEKETIFGKDAEESTGVKV